MTVYLSSPDLPVTIAFWDESLAASQVTERALLAIRDRVASAAATERGFIAVNWERLTSFTVTSERPDDEIEVEFVELDRLITPRE
jgi:hypothetical protein